MKLTNTAVLNAKPKDKDYKLSDGDGMYLYVTKAGNKFWRFKYRINGKEKKLSLGAYPEVSLKEAREKRNAARKITVAGQDPNIVKQEERHLAILNAENTFKSITEEWHETNKSKWTQEHADKVLRRMELHIFPTIGTRPIKEIKPLELLETLRKVENRGATELSHRLLQTCTNIFRYAIVLGKTEYNPAADLAGALKPHKEEHYPSIPAKELPNFYRKLEAAQTSELNKIAIKMLLLTFLRQGELRKSEWEHVDIEAKEWRVPAHIMKMRDAHIIPLSKQTIAILGELQALTGHSKYLFPSQHVQKNLYMSENTMGRVIKKLMGYQGEMVGHGVRTIASTVLNEHGFKPDIIERQLAHAERNQVRAAYNRAEYLPERSNMMQWWADYLERAANGGGNVIDGKFGTKE